jgi:peptidoglycan hydrolase-like protein with peptidoglycan-binding domain
MKRAILGAILPVMLILGGCATIDKTRVDDLESRVAALEGKTKGTTTTTSSRETSSVTSETTLAPSPEAPETPSKADVQAALKNSGHYDGPVDGKFGPKSKKAVEDFQNANGLVADGKVGPNTWNKLKTYWSPAAQETSSDK